MTTYASKPDISDRKGSLFLRSDHMNYSRATLNSNWHQAREAETKDYDINRDAHRDLCKASYHRIGNVTDGSLPPTTYQDFADQIHLKDDFTEQDNHKTMITPETVGDAHLDRDTGTPKRGYGAVLPSHHPEFNKYHLETTHRTDYKPPYPYTPAEEKHEKHRQAVEAGLEEEEFRDYTLAYKKCNSQFSDTADYRRLGRNTWQDESGIYANSHFKAECPSFKTRNPVTLAFQKS